jgi:hypothetical protein
LCDALTRLDARAGGIEEAIFPELFLCSLCLQPGHNCGGRWADKDVVRGLVTSAAGRTDLVVNKEGLVVSRELSGHSRDQKYEDPRVKGLPNGTDSRQCYHSTARRHLGKCFIQSTPRRRSRASLRADTGKTCCRLSPEDSSFFVRERMGGQLRPALSAVTHNLVASLSM